jgi:N-acyl-D-glutamate deacylase
VKEGGLADLILVDGNPMANIDLVADVEKNFVLIMADITIFDPQTVTDNATCAKGTLPSTGILHVLVNGVIVMKDQEPLKDVNPGQPIRFEVQEKGRFEPLTIEGWTKRFYTVPQDFGGGVPGSQPDIH